MLLELARVLAPDGRGYRTGLQPRHCRLACRRTGSALLTRARLPAHSPHPGVFHLRVRASEITERARSDRGKANYALQEVLTRHGLYCEHSAEEHRARAMLIGSRAIWSGVLACNLLAGLLPMPVLASFGAPSA